MPRYAKGKRPARVIRSAGWEDDDYERGYYEEEEPFRPHLDVDDHEAVDTGLIWSTGEPIFRLPNGIGFNAEID